MNTTAWARVPGPGSAPDPGQVQRVIERDKVAAVYPKGSKIVIETDTGRVLFSDDVEGDSSRLRSAFVDRGYPWEGPPE